MKTILLSIITLIHFTSCQCPPKNADGTKAGPCRYVGPSIQATFGYEKTSVSFVIFGEPSLPTITIPVNKHDPLPILTK